MDHIVIPTKQQVRDWLIKRQQERTPLPSREQILQDLGWKLKDRQDACSEAPQDGLMLRNRFAR